MSSIVADVLQSTGKLAKENIVLKVDDLKRKLEDIKLEVQESLKNRYVDFIPEYVKIDTLINDINHVTGDYDVLHNQIEKEIKPQMVSSVVEFNDVVEDLKRIKKLKSVALKLLVAHQKLDDAKNLLLQCSYLNAVRNLMDFEIALKDIALEEQKDIEIISALKTEFYVTKESLIYKLENVFQERILITSSLEGRKKSLCITFNKTAFVEEDVELLISLKLMKQLKPALKKIGKQFLNGVCETALSKIVRISRPQDSMLSMTIVNDNSPGPSEAFKVLKEVLSFLNEEFFQLPTTEDEDEQLNSLMCEFGIVIGEEFSSLVIEKCLKLAIPKQSRQLEKFHKEMVAAEDFCKSLQQMGFMSCSANKLLNFIYEVDTLPVNKMAQDQLSRARSLMQKNLHQTVEVGNECSASETMDASQLNEMSGNKNALSKATFLFPKCQVSESVKDLTKLLFDVKEEARIIDSVHAPRLYYVARNICELYCCVVPTYHKEEIENIPQQTAIFHNNCMYLAHHIATLGVQLKSDRQLLIPITFVDLIPEIQKLGIEAFLAQMRHQKQQLLQLVKEQTGYASLLIEDGSVNKAEKAIRQCLCQLQLLKKVWSDVLPVEVYFKAIGTLFNTCLDEIILRITSMEDIAAEASAQLDSIFAILLRQGPDLFKISSLDKSNSVHVYVRKWFKFQELQIILSASMREIVDRWSSGKGPLATHFTSDEVKRLIRALFQNTERRAAALAKIR